MKHDMFYMMVHINEVIENWWILKKILYTCYLHEIKKKSNIQFTLMLFEHYLFQDTPLLNVKLSKLAQQSNLHSDRANPSTIKVLVYDF